MRVHRGVALVAVAALAVGACGGGGGGGSDTTSGRCPLDALAQADQPVDITIWHQMSANNGRVFAEIIDDFNASQGEVRVSVVDNSAEGSSLPKYKAGLSTGDLPDVVQLEETTLQTMIDSQSTLPVEACVKADGYDLSDFLPRAIAYYTVDGVLRSMPYNVSNPILFYDKPTFEKAGLDPDRPPTTLEEVREYSQQIVDSGAAKHGIAFRMAPFLNEFWYSKDGKLYAAPNNGREQRATRALLDTPAGRELWTWLDEMVASGLGLYTSSAEGDATHLLALGTHDAAMTIEGSGVLGPIMAVLNSGQYPGVDVGTAPMPGLRPGGGVQTAEGSLWISNRSSPAEQAAAWKLIKHLVSTESLIRLHVETSYVPIRTSVAELTTVQELWAEQPEYRTAYDQLAKGPTTPATTGPVIGAFPEVREAVRRGFEAMLVGDSSAREALAQAQRNADEAIRDYNERIG